MTVRRPPDGTLVVDAGDNRWAFVFLALFVALAGMAVSTYRTVPYALATERFQGSVGGATMTLVGFLVTFERARFVFDPHRREVRWRRRRVFRARDGTIPFAAITAIIAQRPLRDDGAPRRRLVLTLADGEVPLTAGYARDADDRALRLAAELRQLVGLADEKG